MLGPILCGSFSRAPLLPKLRGHFAEFLNNASPAGLRILSSSTCVGLRYGCDIRNSGFSRQPVSMLRYFCSLRFTLSDCMADLPAIPSGACTVFPFQYALLCPHSSDISQYRNFNLLSIGYVFRPRLILGPDLPRADQLYPGNLGYSAEKILTSLSLLIPAFSLQDSPPPPSVWLRSVFNAPLPIISDSRASVSCFSPGHFRRRTSRPVSYYALF